MVLKKYILIFFSCFLISCGGYNAITIQGSEIRDDLMKIDGYYYGLMPESGDYVDVYLFYKNGLVYSWGSYKMSDSLHDRIEESLSDSRNFDRLKNNRSGWGYFRTINKNLDFEIWTPKERRPGKYKTELYSANIVNDSTIEMSNMYSSYRDRNYPMKEKYHFRQFSPKPDSTNTFID